MQNFDRIVYGFNNPNTERCDNVSNMPSGQKISMIDHQYKNK